MEKSKVVKSKLSLLDKLKSTLGTEIISVSSNGEIYKYPDHLNTDLAKKNFRTNMRKQLDTYYSLIVLSGQNNPDLEKDLNDFKKDYFNFWKINNFKIDSFTNCREAKKPKMASLLNVLKQFVELSK